MVGTAGAGSGCKDSQCFPQEAIQRRRETRDVDGLVGGRSEDMLTPQREKKGRSTERGGRWVGGRVVSRKAKDNGVNNF